MHLTRGTGAIATLALSITALGFAAPSSAAAGDYFVVDTQFYPGQSAVVDATGVFDDCTMVKDLFVTGEEVGGVLHFLGAKRVSCGSGAKVFLEYDVAFSESPPSTSGTWTVVESTLAGVDVGDGGTLVGTGACTSARYAGGCVLDRFTLTS